MQTIARRTVVESCRDVRRSHCTSRYKLDILSILALCIIIIIIRIAGCQQQELNKTANEIKFRSFQTTYVFINRSNGDYAFCELYTYNQRRKQSGLFKELSNNAGKIGAMTYRSQNYGILQYVSRFHHTFVFIFLHLCVLIKTNTNQLGITVHTMQ